MSAAVKITDLYPVQVQYRPGAPLSFMLKTSDRAAGFTVQLTLTHLHQEVATETLLLEDSQTHTLCLNTTLSGSTGYGLEAKLFTASGDMADSGWTAFDITSHWSEAPRYGFLCHFGPEELGDRSDVEFLQKMHINLVQFYDWMYRHDHLVTEQTTYTDPLGRKLSRQVVEEKIEAVNQHGMQAIAYGAIYASLGDFFQEHRDWALYQNDGTAYTLAGIFHIMDISPGSPWNSHIIDEFLKVIKLGFNGLHLDQYGFPKKGFTSQGELIDMASCFAPFIDTVRDAVSLVNTNTGLIFNNVSNYPTYATASAKQDVIYIEVWTPITDYRDLKVLIDNARQHGGEKQVILAAYLSAFQNNSEYSQREAEIGALVTMAVIFANGAYHLLFGENQRVLTEGYYPNNGAMSDSFIQEARDYYDFIVCYRELLFSADLLDLSFTHTGGYNSEIGRDNEFEFVKAGVRFAPHGDVNTIWTLVKENEQYVVINLINLLGIEDARWNSGKEKAPTPVEEIKVRALIPEGVSEVYYASPDNKQAQLLPAREVASTNGHMVEVEIPRLDIWGLLYFVKRKEM